MLTKTLFRVTVLSLSLCFITLVQAQGENQEEAKEFFQKALDLNKGRSVSSEEMLRQKEYFYRKAIELYPDYAQAHNNLGDVYENLGRYKDAITHYQKVVELRPDAAFPYFGLGDVYFKTGRYEEAIKWYEKGLKWAPQDEQSRQKLSEAKDIIKQGVIQAETIRSVLGKKTVRNVGGTRNPPRISFKIPFAFNTATISPEAIPQLKEIGKALSSEKLSGVSFKIAGHTDPRGSREYNQSLSERRAESVKKYLEKHFNLPSARFIARGYGKDRPVAFGDDEVSYALNRRVEVERVEKEDEALLTPQKVSVDVGFLYEDRATRRPAKMFNGMTLTSKDNYKVYFKPQQDCWVYVFQKDTSRKMTQLFPNSDFTPLGNPVKANKDCWIPMPDMWLYLDETVGEETIYLLATLEPAEDVIEIMSAMKNTSSQKERMNRADKLVVQIKTRGVAPTVRPATQTHKESLYKSLTGKESFYTEITFYHR